MTINRFYEKVETIAKNYYSEKLFCSLDYYVHTKNISSPIEKMFCLALILMSDSNFVEGEIKIHPQYKIEKYYCDFMIEYNNLTDSHPKIKESKIIIELDSQEFHDTNEKQRRYEKKRERLIISKGFRIIRFTGKEITDNPFIPVIETLTLLTGTTVHDLNCYE